MRYYGGKARSGKEIAELFKKIISELPFKIKGYVEPFCGALGVMVHMTDGYFDCYASDGCEDLILLWKKVQKGKFTKVIVTEKKWRDLKYSKVHTAERAFAGFGSSFSGVFFHGYINHDPNGKKTYDIAYESIKKIEPSIKNVKFSHSDYKIHNKLIEKGGYLIYCDPPYSNTECTFGSEFKFDSVEFWKIITQWKKWGNIVIVSEKTAPRGFKCIWEKSTYNPTKSFRNNGSGYESNYTDKLFIGY